MTLSDFPGLTAAILFTQGCNFCCPFCHNKILLDIHRSKSQLMDIDSLIETLRHRKKILDGLVITGGEPTIQEDLFPFIKEVRKIGYKIKLDTNGSRPNVIKKLLEHNILDYIAMDIKAPFEKYNLLCGVEVEPDAIKESIHMIGNADLTSMFRTTYVPALLSEKDIESIRSLVPYNSQYKVQRFVPQNTEEQSFLEYDGTNMKNGCCYI